MDDKNEIISSHIFVFPFRWDYISNGEFLYSSINKRLSVDKIAEILLEEKTWEEEKLEIDNDDQYNKYTYFYDNVRDAIYGRDNVRNVKKEIICELKRRILFLGEIIKKKTKNRIVRCFKYDKLNDNSTYNIKICKKEKPYLLNIKAIKLKIYDTGVGALSFFLENYKYSLPEDILNINDYGRRIYPQYLPLKDVKNSFLAEKITLNLSTNKYDEEFTYDAKACPNRISDVIMKLLGNKFNYNKKALKKGQVFIAPIIDDRMFTLCIYRDNFMSQLITKGCENNYLNSRFWYEYVFIDHDDPTCHDEKMYRKLVEKSTYTRWKDCGTLYGISRYSFVVIVNESDFGLNVLFKHFENMYYEMALLALIERASILRLSDEASKIAALDEEEALQNIKKLQRYYVEFINDLYFREVTAQEQGIEMFNKLVEMMEIERDVKRLGDEIEGIQKYTSMISNERISTLLRIITYIGLIFTACTFAIKVFGTKFVPMRKWNFNLIGHEFNLWFVQRLMIGVGFIGIIIFIFEKLIKTEHMNMAKKIFWTIFLIILIIFICLDIVFKII